MVEVIHGGHDAILEFPFGCDADMTRGSGRVWTILEVLFCATRLRRERERTSLEKTLHRAGEASSDTRDLRSAETANCDPLVDEVSMHGARPPDLHRGRQGSSPSTTWTSCDPYPRAGRAGRQYHRRLQPRPAPRAVDFDPWLSATITARIVSDHHTSLLMPRTSVHTPRSSSDVGYERRCSFRGEILKITSGANVHQTFTMPEIQPDHFLGAQWLRWTWIGLRNLRRAKTE
jgi:hypothetical protein